MNSLDKNLSPSFINNTQNQILEELIGLQSSQLSVDELGLVIATHIGSKRDRNEDRLAVARVRTPNETYTLAIVCDGVGGSDSGDIAAALTVANILSELSTNHKYNSLRDLSISLVKGADDYVRNKLQGRGATTLVMLLATKSGNMICASVGDSRVYSWDLELNKISQVTIDDTIENELKGLPDNGASLINARNLQGQLTQAIGEPGRTSDDLRVQIYNRDKFPAGAILGTDGLWRISMDFSTIVKNSTSSLDAARKAITIANWVGGVDNSSIIAIENIEKFLSENTDLIPYKDISEIRLWSPSTKVKIINNYSNIGRRPSETNTKTTKPKGGTRKKASPKKDVPSQLSFDTDETKDSKPTIEVIINDQ